MRSDAGAASRGQPAAIAGRAGAVDVSITEWAADLTAPATEPFATITTAAGASGFVDFDVIDSVHTGPQVAAVARER